MSDDHKKDIEISILINNYNYGRFLATAIESAFAQTISPKEVIVIDDGSTDNSDEVGQSFSAPNYRYIKKENGGQNSAVEFGLQHITADYVITLDSDDSLLPHACETIIRNLQQAGFEPNAVMYRLEKFDAGGNSVGFYPGEDFLKSGWRDYLFKHGYIPSSPTSGNAYKMEFIRECFDCLLSDSLTHDGYMAWAAASTERILIINEVLGNYLIHGSNVSLSAAKGADKLYRWSVSYLFHTRNLCEFLKNRGEKPLFKELIGWYVWREILKFKLTRNAHQEFSYRDCLYYGVRKFLAGRQFGLRKRIKNIAFIVVGVLAGWILEAFNALKVRVGGK